MINIMLYLIEFFFIVFLSFFSLGSEEQVIRLFREAPTEILVRKFLIISFLTLLLSVCLLFISYLFRKNKKLLKKRIIQHSIFAILMTILILTMKYIQHGYI